MIWQDYALFATEFMLVAGNVPIVLSPNKPPFSASIMTAITLTGIATIMTTMNLIAYPILVGVSATLWWTITYQTYRR